MLTYWRRRRRRRRRWRRRWRRRPRRRRRRRRRRRSLREYLCNPGTERATPDHVDDAVFQPLQFKFRITKLRQPSPETYSQYPNCLSLKLVFRAPKLRPIDGPHYYSAQCILQRLEVLGDTEVKLCGCKPILDVYSDVACPPDDANVKTWLSEASRRELSRHGVYLIRNDPP